MSCTYTSYTDDVVYMSLNGERGGLEMHVYLYDIYAWKPEYTSEKWAEGLKDEKIKGHGRRERKWGRYRETKQTERSTKMTE